VRNRSGSKRKYERHSSPRSNACRFRKGRVSDHGYDELANDGILAQEVLAGLDAAIVIEDYKNEIVAQAS
jgi:hypothetical protein